MRKASGFMPSDPAMHPLVLAGWQRWLTAQQALLLAVWFAIGLGIAVRATHVLTQDFPLNDGGLFYAMTEDLQDMGYRLPAITSYNDAQIPFAYSPLGFYIVGMLNDLTGLSLVELFRWLPLLITSLTVLAFWLLAQEMLPSRLAAIIAVMGFGVLPRSFVWLIMGGGLTRGPGYLFALLALHQVLLLYKRRNARHALLVALCATLTVLSHLGTAPFLAISSGLLFLFYGRHRHGILSSLAIAAATLLLTSPWWVSIVLAHGLAPFQAASASGSSIFSSFSWQQLPVVIAQQGFGTSEPVLPIIGMLALLGTIPALRQGHYLLLLWWIVIECCDTRAGSTYASAPVALLMGLGVTEVLLPVLMRYQPSVFTRAATEVHIESGVREDRRAPLLPAPRLTVLVLGGLLLFTVASATTTRQELRGELPILVSLTRSERQAMRWVDRNTPPESRFLVITASGWEIDRTSEWFPVLSGRVSVATVQGTEWIPNGIFIQQQDYYNRVQRCAHSVAFCLQKWSQRTGITFTHVYIPKLPSGECCKTLRDSLRKYPDYYRIYDGPGASIFAIQRVEQASHTQKY